RPGSQLVSDLPQEPLPPGDVVLALDTLGRGPIHHAQDCTTLVGLGYDDLGGVGGRTEESAELQHHPSPAPFRSLLDEDPGGGWQAREGDAGPLCRGSPIRRSGGIPCLGTLVPPCPVRAPAWQRPMLLGADRTEAAGSGKQPGRASRDGDLRAIPESRDGLITHCETETALFSDRIGVAEATSAAPGVEDRALDLTRLLQPNEGRLRAGVSHGAVSWYADSKCSLLIALITFGPDHRPSDARPGCVKDTGSLGRTPYFLCLARPNGHPPKVTAISIAWNIRAILLPFLAR